MSYRLTRVIFREYVQLGKHAQIQSASVDQGFQLRQDEHGFVIVTKPSWPVSFHVPPALIAGLESEHVAPAPTEDTVVTRRPRKPGTKEAA